MGCLTVLKSGLQTSLQDQGRPGLAFYAIPRSGPMDPVAAELANAILLNDPNQPTLECNFTAPTLRFETNAMISLTGADMGWLIDGVSVKRNTTISVSAGSSLTGFPATDSCRAYIGIHGSIKTERTFGSASCFALCGFGGNQGAPLAAGNQIHWEDCADLPTPIRLKIEDSHSDEKVLPIHAGPEYDWLTKESKMALAVKPFAVSSDSNRMGARLTGPKLSTNGRTLTDSLPLLPGFIQLTPAGQAIVVLQDGQTTGGYPRIAYLRAAALAKLNQTPIQQSFQFLMKK